jgi:hypothetical protein
MAGTGEERKEKVMGELCSFVPGGTGLVLVRIPSPEWLGYGLSPAGLGWSGREEFLSDF